MERKRVGIVVFDDVEVLDFCGPFEVFTATRLNDELRREEPSPFDVLLVAEQERVVTTNGGMRVLPDRCFANCPCLDILVVPGGWGARREGGNPVMLDWVRQQAFQVELLTAVCTGSMILGYAGVLGGRCATTHWRMLDWMRDTFPNVAVLHNLHVVEDGNVITSAGISAGIDMALTVVARCHGEAVARATAMHMEYPYPETLERRARSRVAAAC